MDLSFFSELIYQAKASGKRVYLCGNGGSAANAQHIANDWLAVGVRAIALTNLASLTAIANDFGYADIFARQLTIYADTGDLLVVLTGSGNSQNIINAVTEANKLGLYSYAITGGGQVRTLVNAYVLTHTNMQESEQTQLDVGHHVAEYIKTRTH